MTKKQKERVEEEQKQDPTKVLVMGIVQTAFLARLQYLGTLALDGKCSAVSVYPPSDFEYDAVRKYIEELGIVPKSELSLAGTGSDDAS